MDVQRLLPFFVLWIRSLLKKSEVILDVVAMDSWIELVHKDNFSTKYPRVEEHDKKEENQKAKNKILPTIPLLKDYTHNGVTGDYYCGILHEHRPLRMTPSVHHEILESCCARKAKDILGSSWADVV